MTPAHFALPISTRDIFLAYACYAALAPNISRCKVFEIVTSTCGVHGDHAYLPTKLST